MALKSATHLSAALFVISRILFVRYRNTSHSELFRGFAAVFGLFQYLL